MAYLFNIKSNRVSLTIGPHFCLDQVVRGSERISNTNSINSINCSPCSCRYDFALVVNFKTILLVWSKMSEINLMPLVILYGYMICFVTAGKDHNIRGPCVLNLFWYGVSSNKPNPRFLPFLYFSPKVFGVSPDACKWVDDSSFWNVKLWIIVLIGICLSHDHTSIVNLDAFPVQNLNLGLFPYQHFQMLIRRKLRTSKALALHLKFRMCLNALTSMTIL